MKFEIYKDKIGEWRWRLKAKNHKIIAHGEGYKRKRDCIHCVNLVLFGIDWDTPLINLEDQSKLNNKKKNN